MKFNRRKFIKRLLVTIVSLEGTFLIKRSINKSTHKTNEKELFNAGKITDFTNGKTYPFLKQQFFLNRFEDGGFLAMSVKCTHLSCIVQKSSNGFECPCHASQFNKYGEVTHSPATRPLDLFEIIIKNDRIFIDINKKIKRQSFTITQLTYVHNEKPK